MIVTTCPAPPALPVEEAAGPTTRAFVVGFAQVLLVPVTGLAALLAPLAGAGSLSADGLVVWGPVGAVFAVALVSAYSPHRVSLRSRGRRAR